MNVMHEWLGRLERLDASRPNIPGEHWVALAGGIGLWLASRRSRNFALRLGGAIVASLLVARSAQGRAVPRPIARLRPRAPKLPGR